MRQITIDEFVEVESPKRLILCSMTKHFHWIRISKGDVPENFQEKVSFTLREFDYLYLRTQDKEDLLGVFEGSITSVPFDPSGMSV